MILLKSVCLLSILIGSLAMTKSTHPLTYSGAATMETDLSFCIYGNPSEES